MKSWALVICLWNLCSLPSPRQDSTASLRMALELVTAIIKITEAAQTKAYVWVCYVEDQEQSPSLGLLITGSTPYT